MATISHIIENINKKIEMGTSLMVQWLRLHPSNPGGLGLMSGQETGSCLPQQRVCMPQLRPGTAK